MIDFKIQKKRSSKPHRGDKSVTPYEAQRSAGLQKKSNKQFWRDFLSVARKNRDKTEHLYHLVIK